MGPKQKKKQKKHHQQQRLAPRKSLIKKLAKIMAGDKHESLVTRQNNGKCRENGELY